jgi:hypothetical protein
VVARWGGYVVVRGGSTVMTMVAALAGVAAWRWKAQVAVEVAAG